MKELQDSVKTAICDAAEKHDEGTFFGGIGTASRAALVVALEGCLMGGMTEAEVTAFVAESLPDASATSGAVLLNTLITVLDGNGQAEGNQEVTGQAGY